jgi:hypothetical protein
MWRLSGTNGTDEPSSYLSSAMKTEFINELGNKIGVSAHLRNDGMVVWALWSDHSCQSGVITQREAARLAEALFSIGRL